MEPYEGREPYIFISYARKDAERAAPFLDALSGAGYRFWYDAGIQAGARWTETLVEKVENCAAFCPLFSEAFNASRFCLEETEYAYRKDRTIVPIYLEEMSQNSLRPLYRLLGSRQDLRLYQFENAAQFVERVKREKAFSSSKAPEWYQIGEIQWRLSADGVLEIARNEDMLWSIVSIPNYQSDPTQGGSTAPWMPYRKEIVSVEIADNINAIGDCAFAGCENLTSAHMPDCVTKIGRWAFSGCENLTDVRIPDNVTEISDYTFAYCESMTDMRIPDSVIKIGYSAFWDCFSLTDVRIPDSIIKISDCAFRGCKSLTAVRIPDGVTEIGDGAFEQCYLLTDVRIPDSVTKIGGWAFKACESLTNVRIPDSVTKIGKWAFDGCKNLKSVEIPAKAQIGVYAFDERTSIIRRTATQ